jgi:hypothetical protein
MPIAPSAHGRAATQNETAVVSDGQDEQASSNQGRTPLDKVPSLDSWIQPALRL